MKRNLFVLAAGLATAFAAHAYDPKATIADLDARLAKIGPVKIEGTDTVGGVTVPAIFFGARKIRLRLGHLRIQAGDLCIQRLHLQHELVVADDADDLALADVITLSNRQLCDRSADAGARWYDINTFDSGKDGLFVCNRFRPSDKSFLGKRSPYKDSEQNQSDSTSTHFNYPSNADLPGITEYYLARSGARSLTLRKVVSSRGLASCLWSAHGGWRAIDPIESAGQFARRITANRIPDGLPIAPRPYKPVLAQ